MLDVVLRQLSPSVALEYLEQALSYSMPNYEYQDLVSWSLSRNEVKILNSIAIMYGENGNLDSCIVLLYKLKKHYDNRKTTTPYRLKLYELVLRNLNKYLGLQGRHEEAIEIGNKGIQICMQSGNMNLLPIFLYSNITNDVEKQHFMVSFYQKQYNEMLQIGDVIV